MGNEQAGGTSHHFQNDDNQLSKRGSLLWTKNGRIPLSKQVKPSWHLARDVSMDILSRKATKLNVKAGRTPVNSMYCSYLDFFFVESQMSIYAKQKMTLKKFPIQPPAPGKPLPTYRVPRMPTEKEVADVKIHFFLFFKSSSNELLSKDHRCLSTSMRILRRSLYWRVRSVPCLHQKLSCSMCVRTWLYLRSIAYHSSTIETRLELS